MPITLVENMSQWDELLEKNTYVVTDFFASWCPPCKAIAPLFEKLSNDNALPSHFAFAKVNVDDSPDIARKYGVTAMPTFLFFEGGKPYSKKGMIRGADPRNLTNTVQEIGAAAKVASEGPAKTADTPPADKAEEKATVSGGYAMDQDHEKRSDWKTSLNP